MSAAATPLEPDPPDAGGAVGPQDPWPGLLAFREEDRDFFHGRERDVERLLQQVDRQRLTVLFSLSGLGKTSLLRAGLFPRLRRRQVLPVYVRIDWKDARHPMAQIKAAILAEARRAEVEAPPFAEPECLWGYFHRRGTNFWDRKNEIVVPLLVLDQFEELFTQGQGRPAERDALLEELGDLIEGRLPAAVEARLEADPRAAEVFDRDWHDYKVLLSLREDFLADLEGLRPEIRSLARAGQRLLRLSGEDALRAVEKAGGSLFEPGVAERTVRFVAGDGARPLPQLEVEPALLSLLCRELNQERRRRGLPRITAGLLEVDRAQILADFFESCLAGAPPALRLLIEDRLVTESGFRDSVDLETALRQPGVGREQVRQLEDRRLLRVDDRSGRPRLELTHDVLTGVVRASRDVRREREERRSLLRKAAALFLILTAVAGVVTGLSIKGANDEREAREREERARRSAQRALVLPAGVMLEKGRVGEALAYLVEAMKSTAPGDDMLAARSLALDLLLRGTWPIQQATLPHDDQVLWAEIGPAGRAVVTASRDGTARLWDAATGQPAGAPLRHQRRVGFARFSRDGRRVLTASSDGTARLWDVATGRQLTPPLRHGDAVWSGEWSPDGRLVATASLDDTARLWDAATGKPLPIPALQHGDQVYSVMFDRRGERLVTASLDRTARVWEVASGRLLFTLAHAEGVQSADWSADGRRIVTASRDQTARLWDAATGRPVGEPMRHQDWLSTASFDAAGRRVVTASLDGTARVWDAANGKPVSAPVEHDNFVNFVHFSPDGAAVVTASQDGTARLWDARTGEPLSEPMAHDDAVRSAVFGPDGRQVVTASDDGTARLWNVQAVPARERRLPALRPGSQAIAVEPAADGRTLLARTVDHRLELRDAATGRALGVLPARGRVWAARFLDDGRPAALVEDGGTLGLWDVRTGEALASWRPPGEVAAACLAPDGRRVAVAAGQGLAVEVRDLRTGEPAGKPLAHARRVAACAFGGSAGSGRLVTVAGREAEVVQAWDPVTGEALGPPLRHPDTVESAQLDPEGKRVATACEDGAARLWDLATGKLLAEPLRHGGKSPEDREVRAAWFSPDGRRIVTAGADETARVWDTATGQPLGRPLRHGVAVWSARFSPDGQQVVTAAEDGALAVWDVPTGSPGDEELLADWAEAVGGREIGPTGTAEALADAPGRLAALRRRAAQAPAGDRAGVPALLRWFLTPPGQRPPSPLQGE